MTDTHTLDEKEELLRKIPLFSSLPKRTLRQIAEDMVPRSYPDGKTIVKRGDFGLGLFSIVRGSVAILVSGPEGERCVGTYGPGAFFGEIALLDQAPRTADVVAKGEVECLLLTKDAFDAYSKRHPELAWEIIPVLTSKIREATEQLSSAQESLVAVDQQAKKLRATLRRKRLKLEEPPPPPARTGRTHEVGPKELVKDRILDMVRRSYSLRLLVHTYTAILGCPVSLALGPTRRRSVLARFGEVQVAFLHLGDRGPIEVIGEGRGHFDLTVFAPGPDGGVYSESTGPVPVDRGTRVRYELGLPGRRLLHPHRALPR